MIYYLFGRDDVCYLVFAYRKSRLENLTDAQAKALSAVMQEVLGDER